MATQLRKLRGTPVHVHVHVHVSSRQRIPCHQLSLFQAKVSIYTIFIRAIYMYQALVAIEYHIRSHKFCPTASK